MNTYTNTSSTPCSVIKHCCKLNGFMCEYANENGYCRLTACAYTGVVYAWMPLPKPYREESEVEE